VQRRAPPLRQVHQRPSYAIAGLPRAIVRPCRWSSAPPRFPAHLATGPRTITYDVVSGELVLGRLMKKTQAGNVTVWSWYLNAISGPATEVRTSGYDPDLESPKAWRKWIGLAGLRENDAD
jgi:hypothetical protein